MLDQPDTHRFNFYWHIGFAACTVAVVVIILAVFMLRVWPDGLPSKGAESNAHAAAIPLAVLGDSNSQSYHDPVWFPMQNGERGGAFRSRTFQWTEVLARCGGRSSIWGHGSNGGGPDQSRADASGLGWPADAHRPSRTISTTSRTRAPPAGISCEADSGRHRGWSR